MAYTRLGLYGGPWPWFAIGDNLAVVSGETLTVSPEIYLLTTVFEQYLLRTSRMNRPDVFEKRKTSNEVKTYEVEFTPKLRNTESLSSVAVTAEDALGSDKTSEIVDSYSIVDGNRSQTRVKITLKGGEEDHIYMVNVIATTSSGNKFEATIKLNIIDPSITLNARSNNAYF